MKKILLFSSFITLIFSCYADNKNTLEKHQFPDVFPLSMDSVPIHPTLKYKLPSALFVAGVAFATIPPFHNIEKSIYNGFNRTPRKQINADDYIQYSPAVAVFALDAIGFKGINKPKEQFLLYAMSNVGATLIVQPMKRIVSRERPDKSDFKSFPSGHTTTAFVAAEFLHQEYGHLSPWISIAGYGTAAATGYLRMQNNVHWFGDVLAGAALGILSTKAVYFLKYKVRGTRDRRRGNSPSNF